MRQPLSTLFLFFFSFLSLPLSLSLTTPDSDSQAPQDYIHAETDYQEQLHLRPLPRAALLASFSFRSNTTFSEFTSRNFRLFPRSLGQILSYANTRELHLRFNLGRWDAESWGSRPWNGAREGGTGVELWAWLVADSEAEAERKWVVLTNALSGLFCASLNFIDSTRTTRPVMSFRPEGNHNDVDPGKMHLLHGVLPHEVVCTENLTPFLKLLPCKGKAGIASLLDGHKLFDASWQSMAIDVRPICVGEDECVLQIEQTIDMVLDVDRAKRPRENPIPRPLPSHFLPCDTSKPYHSHDTCFPLDHTRNRDWSLTQVFGRPLKGACPLSNPSIPPICLHVPSSRKVFFAGVAAEQENERENIRCYHLSPEEEFNLVLPPPELPDADELDLVVPPTPPPLYAERSFTGYGQERGGVQALLHNPSKAEHVSFIYFETLPWFMRIYLHTLTARLIPNNSTTSPPKDIKVKESVDLIKKINYRPALDRARPSHLELHLTVPPLSTVQLTYTFDKTILRYTEYPPDANRGFDVPAAIITVLPDDSSDPSAPSPDSNLQPRYSLRTTTLLCSLPTPDFSMPYNVIIFTSTAIALAFGGVFNILVRRFVAADEGPVVGIAALKRRLMLRIGGLLKKLGVKA